MRVFIRSAVVALAISLTCSLPARADRVDDYVKLEMEQQRIPGLSLVVLKNGEVLKVQGYGLANVEHNIPVEVNTVFKIGSISKQFIATGMMLLVQEGKLNLDDKVSKHLDETPVAWKDITIRHLLSHTAGLVRESPGYRPHQQVSDADVIRAAHGAALRFAPGENYEYSNLGYFMAAEIIGKNSGEHWGDYLKQRVFEPLQMKSTRVTSATDIVPNRSDGYAIVDNKLTNSFGWPAVRPSGAFLSTVTDMAKWEAALHTDRVLSPASLKQMRTRGRLNNAKPFEYGLGWGFDDFRGMKTIGHGGTLDGFRSHWNTFVDHDVTVIVLTNSMAANPKIIANCVATRFIPDADLTALKPRLESDVAVTNRLRMLLANIADSAKTFAGATPAFAQVLERVSPSNRKSVGDLLKEGCSFDFLNERDVKGGGIERNGSQVARIRHYRMINGDRVRYGTFYLDADGMVAAFEMSAG